MVTGRYRLLRRVGSPSSTLWEAHDDVLARPVAIRNLPTDAGTDAVLDAARRAGVVPHRTLTRAYDVVDEPDLRLVVREWVEGEPLNDVVADAPLTPDRAIVVISAVADALSAAAEFGVHHGRLHPGHVLLTPDGDVRVTDAATAAALSGAPAGGDTDDVQALGALLYFAVTGRWPFNDQPDLPQAPVEDGKLCTPRQVRAGVPRDVDRLVMECLVPGPTSPASAAGVVTRLTTLRHGEEPTQHIPIVVEPELPPPPRPRWPVYLASAVGGGLVVYLALVALTGGSKSGVPFPDLLHHNATTTLPAKPSHSAAPTPGQSANTAALTPLPLSSATSFDPMGDGSENQSETPNAIDGNPATAWYSETYSRANFGGLKPGVGLLVDAGTAVSPRQVEVDFVAPGATYEIRAADTAASSLDGFTTKGTGDATGAASSTVAITDSAAHRYWLVWLTKLPPVSDGFKAGIATVRLSR